MAKLSTLAALINEYIETNGDKEIIGVSTHLGRNTRTPIKYTLHLADGYEGSTLDSLVLDADEDHGKTGGENHG